MAWAQKRAQVRAQVRPMVGRRGGAVRPDVSLFRAGDTGFLYDFSQTSLLRQLAAGTGAVAGDADPIGWAQSLDPTSRVATQATAGSRPVWKTPNSAHFDGLAYNLLTTLASNLVFSLVCKFSVPSGGPFVFIGGRNNTSTAAFIGIANNGVLNGGVGSQGFGTGGIPGVISGGASLYGAPHVGAVTWDGATVNLYVDGANVYSGAQVLTPSVNMPLRIGAFNNNNVAVNFVAGDIPNAFAINRVLTPAEISNLTNYWGI